MRPLISLPLCDAARAFVTFGVSLGLDLRSAYALLGAPHIVKFGNCSGKLGVDCPVRMHRREIHKVDGASPMSRPESTKPPCRGREGGSEGGREDLSAPHRGLMDSLRSRQ